MRALSLLLLIPALSVLGAGPASAATAGNCLTTYEAALVYDVTVNGPVHGIVIGDFTPGIFLDGATRPTSAFVTCTV